MSFHPSSLLARFARRQTTADRCLLGAVLVAAFLSVVPEALAQPPVNDDQANAEVLDGSRPPSQTFSTTSYPGNNNINNLVERQPANFANIVEPVDCPVPGAVTAIFPPNDLTNPVPCGTDLLRWDAPTSGPPAVRYLVFLDSVLVGETRDTQLSISPVSGGYHEWTVVPVNGCGAGSPATFYFCVQSTPVILFPAADSVVDCAPTYEIRWDPLCTTGTYEVFVDGSLVGQTTGSSLTLSTPLAVGPHTIQIVANGPCGNTATVIQNFCVQSRPVNLYPPDNSVFPVLQIELEWQATCGATTYTVVLNGVEFGKTTATSFPISLPPGSGPHEWEIVAEGDCGPTTGPRWLFTDCDALVAPSGPVPFDGETTTSGFLTQLRWNPVPGAVSYQVFINGSLVATVPTNFYVLSGPLPDADYTWQVIADVRACTQLVPGPIWNFSVCYLAPVPVPLTPFDGETTRPENIRFDWTDVPGIISYRMQLDSFVTADLFVSQFQFGFGIAPGIRQWAPISRTSCGFTTGPVTTFCILDWAVNPVPANGSLLCQAPTEFQWSAVPSAVSYDLILDGSVIATGIPVNQFTYTGTLPEGDHTWQVISYNICGKMASEVWTFTIVQSGVPSGLAWQTDGVVHALVTDGVRMYIGGEFENLVSPTGGFRVPRRNIAAVDLATGLPSNWNPGADGPVFALAVGGGRVYAGGDFTLLGGTVQERVGAVTVAGGTPAPFAATIAPNQAVRALALSPGNNILYIGGDFNRVGPVIRRYLAAIDTVGGNLTGFNPDPNNRVRCLYRDSSGDLFVGGIFNVIGGQNRSGIARLSPSGAVTSWNAFCDLYVYAIKRDGARLLVGGFFTSIGGAQRSNLAALDINTAVAESWNPGVDGTVLAIEPNGDGIFVGGLFNRVGPTNRPYLARVSATDGTASPCGYDPDYPVRAIATTPESVWVGGDFTIVGGQPIRGLVGFGNINAPLSQAKGWELYE